MAGEYKTSLRGEKLWLDLLDRLVAPFGLIVGKQGSQVQFPCPRSAALFDDFTGDTLDVQWGTAVGSDGAVLAAAPLAGGIGGVARLTFGAGAGGTMAVNGGQLHRWLAWRSSQGDLCVQARIRMSAITNISVFVGFTDQIGALEAPINASGSGNGLTTTATDAVGFMFDTSMTDDFWWLTGVANDVDAVAQNTGIAPVAATYVTLRVELTPTGQADFYIDEKKVGTRMTGAVTPGVSLTPVIAGFTRTAASATLDTDYLHVAGTRV